MTNSESASRERANTLPILIVGAMNFISGISVDFHHYGVAVYFGLQAICFSIHAFSSKGRHP